MMFCEETRDRATAPTGRGAELVADSGHSINVSKGAPRFYELTFSWLAARGIR